MEIRIITEGYVIGLTLFMTVDDLDNVYIDKWLVEKDLQDIYKKVIDDWYSFKDGIKDEVVDDGKVSRRSISNGVFNV